MHICNELIHEKKCECLCLCVCVCVCVCVCFAVFVFLKKNLKQEWLLAFWNKIQTQKVQKNVYLLGHKPNLQISSVIPFVKLQSNT